MENYYFIIAVKLFIFLSIINVWFFRFGKSTDWRGGNATSMKEEFEAYGLPAPMLYLVGGLKVLFATLLVVSIWYEKLAIPAAAGMAILMLGAIIMHFKINDPIKKSIPAFSFLVLSLIIIVFHMGN
ncbi:DoxX family protein [uncultured Eudoraea sp.]|uniref:DoxX family protein n=1 Tax=uncultured Eudoraea sp. TaxID=1035614 RepID=UPI002638FDA1|nr:DoxX family protein [uncultured Eudoraea sp.]